MWMMRDQVSLILRVRQKNISKHISTSGLLKFRDSPGIWMCFCPAEEDAEAEEATIACGPSDEEEFIAETGTK